MLWDCFWEVLGSSCKENNRIVPKNKIHLFGGISTARGRYGVPMGPTDVPWRGKFSGNIFGKFQDLICQKKGFNVLKMTPQMRIWWWWCCDDDDDGGGFVMMMIVVVLC